MNYQLKIKVMKTKGFFLLSDPEILVGQFKTEVKNALRSELKVLQLPEKQNSVVYLTRAEVAEKLKCSKSTIYRMVKNDGLRCYKFGRKTLFRTTDVEAALIQLNTKGGNYAY